MKVLLLLFSLLFLQASSAQADPSAWAREWPKTDFTQSSVDFSEIRSGGPPKDGIPAIDAPQFEAVQEHQALADQEPVISLQIGDEARAYPLRILIWHEIVNDEMAGQPIAVTYCPLCNAAIVFDRRLGERTLDFGTTGKLRNSDLIMYDRQSESWWQQFSGEAILGDLMGERLKSLPARLESWQSFRSRFPQGQVLVPTNPGFRPYGANPYGGYDSSPLPFLYDGSLPEGIAPMAYVVAVGDEAWALEDLKQRGRIEAKEVILTWSPGLASPLDTREMAKGRDLGNVVAQRKLADGTLEDIVYDLTFAFVFHAFHPDGQIHPF